MNYLFDDYYLERWWRYLSEEDRKKIIEEAKAEFERIKLLRLKEKKRELEQKMKEKRSEELEKRRAKRFEKMRKKLILRILKQYVPSLEAFEKESGVEFTDKERIDAYEDLKDYLMDLSFESLGSIYQQGKEGAKNDFLIKWLNDWYYGE